MPEDFFCNAAKDLSLKRNREVSWILLLFRLNNQNLANRLYNSSNISPEHFQILYKFKCLLFPFAPFTFSIHYSSVSHWRPFHVSFIYQFVNTKSLIVKSGVQQQEASTIKILSRRQENTIFPKMLFCISSYFRRTFSTTIHTYIDLACRRMK